MDFGNRRKAAVGIWLLLYFGFLLLPLAAAPPPFETVQSALAEACAVFTGFDHNGDGIAEIEHLSRAPEEASFPYERAGSGRGLVLVLVEERLWKPEEAPDLRPSLATYVADLAAEGYEACLITASVYAGEKHQDGRTVLALRAFFRRLAAVAPSFQGAVLVGNFPEAFLVRQYFWRLHGPITIQAGQPAERKFEEPVDYWRTRAEPIALRSELVLADLDGRWDEVYHEAPQEIPYAIAVFPEGAEAADGVTEHYEFGSDRFVDFFFIHDGRWGAEPAGPGKLRFFPLSDRDDECAPADLSLPNPMCRPEISVSRINAYHAGVDPSPEVQGTSGEGLLDANGKPQPVTFADQESTPHPLHIWIPSPALERRLLVEYFERNHRYRRGRYADACKAACIGTEWDSSLPEILQAFAPSEGNPTGLEVPPGEGYDVQGGKVELLDFVRWMKQPALLRVIKAHTDPWGSTFSACTDLEALHREVGGTIWHWKRAENVLTPSLEQESGKASFATYRTMWENKVLPEAASMFLHTGCDSISPEGTNDRPYNAPRYGFWQGAECLLMYGQGLVLLGRAKVFNDEPRELFQTLAVGGTWGDAWRRYFEVESQDLALRTDEEGIRQKKAYFWSLIGDWTLRCPRVSGVD